MYLPFHPPTHLSFFCPFSLPPSPHPSLSFYLPLSSSSHQTLSRSLPFLPSFLPINLYIHASTTPYTTLSNQQQSFVLCLPPPIHKTTFLSFFFLLSFFSSLHHSPTHLSLLPSILLSISPSTHTSSFLAIHLTTIPCAYSSTHLSIIQPPTLQYICQSTNPGTYLSNHPLIHLSFSLSLPFSLCLSLPPHPPTHPPIYLFTCLSIMSSHAPFYAKKEKSLC